MARLNIEDQFFLDIIDVTAKVGDQDKAIGNAVRWLRFSQEKHIDGKVMPEDEFFEKGFLEALIPTFAKRTATGIMAVGAEKHFGWLKKRKESGSVGGKKSAQRPRNAKGQLLSSKQNPSETKRSQPSDSDSDSDSGSYSGSDKNTYAHKFDLAWKAYPKKVGKGEGFALLEGQNLSVQDIASLQTAAENYARYCTLSWNDWYTPQNFPVWCGAKSKTVKPWRDWIDPDPSLFVQKEKKTQDDSLDFSTGKAGA